MAMKKRSPAPSARFDETKAKAAGPLAAVIESVGAQGHGIAHIGGKKVFVPFTLPGETVRLELHGSRAEAVEIEAASRERIAPICKHFGSCGGCALQHWSEAPYREWKEALIAAAFSRAGIEASLEPLRTYPVSSRRRATFTARKDRGKIELGFQAARTHSLIDLEECPILLPELAASIPHLRAALGPALSARSEAKVHVTAAANGLDCVIEGTPPLPGVQPALAQTLLAAGFIRAVWNGEPIVLAAAPYVLCGPAKVKLPPGAFLQAVEACEKDMAAWLLAALSEEKASGPICDLFAGLGAFTFPAAGTAPVTAFEDSAAAIEAIAVAAKNTKGIKPITATRRDLYRNPLGPAELNKFAAIIADPPREGAEAQCRALTSSKVPVVAMVSCNPVTFARDAAILTAGCFQLVRLAAFDQFRFSAHVEITALFRRRSEKSRKR
jgi:23S rRNA (uracil1939-C5)-methyltransferase